LLVRAETRALTWPGMHRDVAAAGVGRTGQRSSAAGQIERAAGGLRRTSPSARSSPAWSAVRRAHPARRSDPPRGCGH
jgi:hypothetical protein